MGELKPARRILRPEDFDEIHRLLKEGVSQKEIGRRFGQGQTFISRISRGLVTKDSYHFGRNKVVAHRVPSNYPPETIERGLMEVALAGGNVALASRRLKDRGHDIASTTLGYWVNVSRAGRYAEVAAEHAAKVEEVIVREARENAMKAAEVERLALDKTVEQLEKGQLKDASTAARNAATVKGINVDKTLIMTNRPNQITETRQADDILRKWQELGIIDSDAEEIPPEQLSE